MLIKWNFYLSILFIKVIWHNFPPMGKICLLLESINLFVWGRILQLFISWPNWLKFPFSVKLGMGYVKHSSHLRGQYVCVLVLNSISVSLPYVSVLSFYLFLYIEPEFRSSCPQKSQSMESALWVFSHFQECIGWNIFSLSHFCSVLTAFICQMINISYPFCCLRSIWVWRGISIVKTLTKKKMQQQMQHFWYSSA